MLVSFQTRTGTWLCELCGPGRPVRRPGRCLRSHIGSGMELCSPCAARLCTVLPLLLPVPFLCLICKLPAPRLRGACTPQADKLRAVPCKH